MILYYMITVVYSQIEMIPETGAPPMMRKSNSMTSSVLLNSIIIFGGADNQNYFNDLWLFNLTNYQWSKQYILSTARPGKI